MGRSEQPQGERGAPISQMRKLRLSGKEGTTCPLQSSAQLHDKLQESSSGVPPPSAHEGLEPPPLLHPLHRRGDERKHTLSPSLPPSDSSCAGFAKRCHSPRGLLSPFPASTTTHQLPPPAPQCWPGEQKQQKLPSQRPTSLAGQRAAPTAARPQEVKAGFQDRRPQATLAPDPRLGGGLWAWAASSSSVVLITTALSWDKLAAILPALLSQYRHPVRQGLCDKL